MYYNNTFLSSRINFGIIDYFVILKNEINVIKGVKSYIYNFDKAELISVENYSCVKTKYYCGECVEELLHVNFLEQLVYIPFNINNIHKMPETYRKNVFYCLLLLNTYSKSGKKYKYYLPISLFKEHILPYIF